MHASERWAEGSSRMNVVLAETPLDIAVLRAQFPLLARTVHGGKPLAYLDNANTSQKPACVIEAVDRFYRERNANVSRAVHVLGEEATGLYEGARDVLARFIGAGSARELVLTSGTTMATNLVAYSYLLPRLAPGDVVLTTVMEHHANIVPWQIVCQRTGARVVAAPIHANGELDVAAFIGLLGPQVKLACVTHVSNVLGTINPVAELAAACRKRGVPLLVDGSQAVPHLPVDVCALGCDFYAFTGHKMCGPTGTGGLWARREILAQMPPFFGGGEMIREVRIEESTFADPPARFEAGTPNIAGFAGLAEAVRFLEGIGMARIAAREQDLLRYATARLREVPGLRIIGEAPHKAAVISFLVEGAHAHDLATLLDLEGVAVRSGHHCAHPLMRYYDVPATCRASFAFYSIEAEVDALLDALLKARALLA